MRAVVKASTWLNLASKSSKGKILRALDNFKGPFDTPFSRKMANSKKRHMFAKRNELQRASTIKCKGEQHPTCVT